MKELLEIISSPLFFWALFSLAIIGKMSGFKLFSLTISILLIFDTIMFLYKIPLIFTIMLTPIYIIVFYLDELEKITQNNEN